MVCYSFIICDGRDEPNWEYMAIGSDDKTVCLLQILTKHEPDDGENTESRQ